MTSGRWLAEPSRIEGVLAGVAILTGIASVVTVLVYDSSRDVTCWARCLDEPFVSLGSGGG